MVKFLICKPNLSIKYALHLEDWEGGKEGGGERVAVRGTTRVDSQESSWVWIAGLSKFFTLIKKV